MKIYTKIVIDIKTGKTLKEDSFDYSGPVTLCKGGGESNEVKETAQERALSEVTQQEWNRFKSVYQPLMNKESSYYQGLGTAEKNRITGAVNAGSAKTYERAFENTQNRDISRGVGPSGMAVGLGDVSRDKAETSSSTMVRGETNVDKTKVAGLQNVVGLMRGDAGQSVAGMGDIATNAVNDANRAALYRQQDRNNNFETAATIAGAGLSAVNNYKSPVKKGALTSTTGGSYGKGYTGADYFDNNFDPNIGIG